MARPANLPRWAEALDGTASTNIVEPNGAKKDSGYVIAAETIDGKGDKPTSGGLNWIFRTIYQWIAWAGKGAPVDADDLARKAETDAVQASLNAHAAANPAHAADHISSAATGDVAATNVQGAIAELAAEKATVTAMNAADAALSGRIGTLEGETLNARIAAIEAGEAEAFLTLTLVGGLYMSFATNDTAGATAYNLSRKWGRVVWQGHWWRLKVAGGHAAVPAGTVLSTIPAGWIPRGYGNLNIPAIHWDSVDVGGVITPTNPTLCVVSIDGASGGATDGQITCSVALADNDTVDFDAAWDVG